MKEKILKIMMATDWSMNSKYDPCDAADEIVKLINQEVEKRCDELLKENAEMKEALTKINGKLDKVMEKHNKIIAPRRPYNHLGLKAGDVVIIDREFNNACAVTIVDIGPIGLFATVTDGLSAWDVMTYRLSRIKTEGTPGRNAAA